MMDITSMPVIQDTAINVTAGNTKQTVSDSETSFAKALDGAVKETKEPQIEDGKDNTNVQDSAKTDAVIIKDDNSVQMSMSAIVVNQLVATNTNMVETNPVPDSKPNKESNQVSVTSDNQVLQVLDNASDVKTDKGVKKSAKKTQEQNQRSQSGPVQNAVKQNSSFVEEALANMTPTNPDSEIVDSGVVKDSNPALIPEKTSINQIVEKNASAGIVNDVGTQQLKATKNQMQDISSLNAMPIVSEENKIVDASVNKSGSKNDVQMKDAKSSKQNDKAVSGAAKEGVASVTDPVRSPQSPLFVSEAKNVVEKPLDVQEAIFIDTQTKVNNSQVIAEIVSPDKQISSGSKNDVQMKDAKSSKQNDKAISGDAKERVAPATDFIRTLQSPLLVSEAKDIAEKPLDVQEMHFIDAQTNAEIGGLDKQISSESSSQTSSIPAEIFVQTDATNIFSETIKASVQTSALNDTKSVDKQVADQSVKDVKLQNTDGKDGIAVKQTPVDDNTALQSNSTVSKEIVEKPVKLTASAEKQAGVQEAFFVNAQVKVNNSQKNVDYADLDKQLNVSAAVNPSAGVATQVEMNMSADSGDSKDPSSESSAQTSSMPIGIPLQVNTSKSFFETIKASNQTSSLNDPQPVHTQVADQIIKDVRLLKGIDRSDIVVRLTPPDLGNLRVQITQDASGISSQIVADNTKARDLLQANVPALMESLSNAGVKMDKVSVTSETSFNTFAGNTGFANERNMQNHSRQSAQTYNSFMKNAQILNGMQLEAIAYETSAHSWLA